MAIATTTVYALAVGDTYWVMQKHATPGTDANDVDSGMPHIFGVWGVGSETPDKVVSLTPNASADAGTASDGHFALHAEADKTVYTLAIGKHK